ncbi:hypothetical protein BC831DRAFT_436237 [Entophlyctis helioformis]|nr:hypothetical protein BC831DRAFT_436237 [Entophlyctis helioformis]
MHASLINVHGSMVLVLAAASLDDALALADMLASVAPAPSLDHDAYGTLSAAADGGIHYKSAMDAGYGYPEHSLHAANSGTDRGGYAPSFATLAPQAYDSNYTSLYADQPLNDTHGQHYHCQQPHQAPSFGIESGMPMYDNGFHCTSDYDCHGHNDQQHQHVYDPTYQQQVALQGHTLGPHTSGRDINVGDYGSETQDFLGQQYMQGGYNDYDIAGQKATTYRDSGDTGFGSFHAFPSGALTAASLQDGGGMGQRSLNNINDINSNSSSMQQVHGLLDQSTELSFFAAATAADVATPNPRFEHHNAGMMAGTPNFQTSASNNIGDVAQSHGMLPSSSPCNVVFNVHSNASLPNQYSIQQSTPVSFSQHQSPIHAMAISNLNNLNDVSSTPIMPTIQSSSDGFAGWYPLASPVVANPNAVPSSATVLFRDPQDTLLSSSQIHNGDVQAAQPTGQLPTLPDMLSVSAKPAKKQQRQKRKPKQTQTQMHGEQEAIIPLIAAAESAAGVHQDVQASIHQFDISALMAESPVRTSLSTTQFAADGISHASQSVSDIATALITTSAISDNQSPQQPLIQQPLTVEVAAAAAAAAAADSLGDLDWVSRIQASPLKTFAKDPASQDPIKTPSTSAATPSVAHLPVPTGPVSKPRRSAAQPTNIVVHGKVDRKTLKRMRNKVSASRCREKKKVWIGQMEARSNSVGTAKEGHRHAVPNVAQSGSLVDEGSSQSGQSQAAVDTHEHGDDTVGRAASAAPPKKTQTTARGNRHEPYSKKQPRQTKKQQSKSQANTHKQVGDRSTVAAGGSMQEPMVHVQPSQMAMHAAMTQIQLQHQMDMFGGMTGVAMPMPQMSPLHIAMLMGGMSGPMPTPMPMPMMLNGPMGLLDGLCLPSSHLELQPQQGMGHEPSPVARGGADTASTDANAPLTDAVAASMLAGLAEGLTSSNSHEQQCQQPQQPQQRQQQLVGLGIDVLVG